MSESKPKVIAFYLPQFHPIPENDKWWGKGFTEWTNVGKAKPLYPGHDQPKVPADLGYYDLRLHQIYKEQVELAKEAGLYGFCFWHYYFGNGKQLLEKPLQDVLNDKSDDFPFCLGWANHSWEKKTWNKDSAGNVMLIEQTYGGVEDYRRHFKIVLPFLKDSRYIKVDGKPIFYIFNADDFSDCGNFIKCWRELYEKEFHGGGIHFVAQAKNGLHGFQKYFDMGFDAVFSNRITDTAKGFQKNIFSTIKNLFLRAVFLPRLVNFKTIARGMKKDDDKSEKIYPGILCGWDHTPRSGRKGYVYTNFSMDSFKKHILDIFEIVKDKQDEHKIIFLKSWNEWGEGNFMEPDLKFGKGKIKTLADCLETFNA